MIFTRRSTNRVFFHRLMNPKPSSPCGRQRSSAAVSQLFLPKSIFDANLSPLRPRWATWWRRLSGIGALRPITSRSPPSTRSMAFRRAGKREVRPVVVLFSSTEFAVSVWLFDRHSSVFG